MSIGKDVLVLSLSLCFPLPWLSPSPMTRLLVLLSQVSRRRRGRLANSCLDLCLPCLCSLPPSLSVMVWEKVVVEVGTDGATLFLCLCAEKVQKEFAILLDFLLLEVARGLHHTVLDVIHDFCHLQSSRLFTCALVTRRSDCRCVPPPVRLLLLLVCHTAVELLLISHGCTARLPCPHDRVLGVDLHGGLGGRLLAPCDDWSCVELFLQFLLVGLRRERDPLTDTHHQPRKVRTEGGDGHVSIGVCVCPVNGLDGFQRVRGVLRQDGVLFEFLEQHLPLGVRRPLRDVVENPPPPPVKGKRALVPDGIKLPRTAIEPEPLALQQNVLEPRVLTERITERVL
mmetsp:Transcript_10398/g.20162  ORF Transcript_10398/g.20162 Transcript_10398/m.20162 type:complete len:341 (-) Transcript_10398:1110-2132(-)